jgi:hypothetical protein
MVSVGSGGDSEIVDEALELVVELVVEEDIEELVVEDDMDELVAEDEADEIADDDTDDELAADERDEPLEDKTVLEFDAAVDTVLPLDSLVELVLDCFDKVDVGAGLDLVKGRGLVILLLSIDWLEAVSV